ncbi:portal protein [Candidatus Pacearchaeota archaeon]|nr:portal protein [Candidatus Pacearchaeota archaeon]
MGTLQDTFHKLKTSIVGTKTSDIDSKLNKAVKNITSYKANSGRNGYIDLVRNLITKTAGSEITLDNQGGIFGQGASTPATFGQGGRLLRYKTYQAIIGNIDYCYRALNVLTDNILAPDDITKTSLEIKPKAFLSDETPTDSKIQSVRQVLKELKIEKNLDIIVKNTLLNGDFFCEIADAKTALTSRALLAEGADYKQQFQSAVSSGEKEEILINEDKVNVKLIMDYSSLGDEDPGDEAGKTFRTTSDPKDGVKEGENLDIEKLSIVFHDPGRVLKLQSDIFPLCFGYLIFPKASTNPQSMMQDQIVNSICASILQSLAKKIPQIEDQTNTDELRDIISSMIQQGDETRAMNIRYVPPERIQHFMVPGMKYAPYGQSIFDAAQFTAKVLIALETALAVQRLARSTEKRKIAVELGLPRDARKMIEKLKEEFRKRKVSLDSFGTVDTIPSMITTFEDVYIPQKDGKAFVDISTFNEGNVDTRSKVDELKFIRDSVVASLGVPPSFLNIEENLSNKAALGEENILFARTIVSHQKYLTIQTNELLQKIFNILSPEQALTLFEHVDVAFPPPKSLQFEREAKYLNDLTTLIESLERVGVPKEYSKKKYLTNIDWEEVRKYELDEQIDKKLGTEQKDDDGGLGMGGGLGGTF